jgi:predicted dehydrogenase
VEETILSAAAAAAPRVFAAEQPSTSPNERLTVAVIGVRGRGGDHAQAFASRPDCQIAYICDADREVGARVAKKFAKDGREPKCVEDMRRIFDDQAVDVVSIATPNHWHSLAAVWAMQAGKDVYVEKPISHNISEGRRVAQVARKYGRICQGGTQYRSSGSIRAAAQYIREGKLGTVKVARCYTYRGRNSIGPAGQYAPPPSVDYNLWAGPAPMAPITRKSFHYDWHWFWDFGNGEIGNNSVHAVDAMRMVLDLQGLGRGVLCYGGRVKFNDAAETANTQIVIHDFNDITVVQEIRNLKTTPPRFSGMCIITGTQGYLAVGGASTVFDLDGKLVQKLEGPGDDHFANFLKAVRSRKREDLNAEIVEGHLSAALCHLGNISYRLGQPASPNDIRERLQTLKVNENVVETFEAIRTHLAENDVNIDQERLMLGPWLEIDSARETFVNNPRADALLTRDYRKPFVVPGENEI